MSRATTEKEATWDFPPLNLALRCLDESRSMIDPGTMAEVAILFRDYGLGSLPDSKHLRDPKSWTAWLPLCAAMYCQRLVYQHSQTGTITRLEEALKALANAADLKLELLEEQDTPVAREMVSVFLKQLQMTARDQLKAVNQHALPYTQSLLKVRRTGTPRGGPGLTQG